MKKKELFTLKQYEANFARLLELPLLPCEYWEHDTDSEDSVRVARGRKDAFENALHFFVNVLRVAGEQIVADVNGEITIGYPEFKNVSSLSADDFQHDFYAFSTSMNCLPSLLPGGFHKDWSNRFIGAAGLEVDWNEIYMLAEFESRYVAVFWATGA